MWSEPSSLAVGQSAKLACTVSFGGPVMNATSPPDTQGLFPHLSLSLGPMLYEPVPVLHRHELGQPGSRKHTITVVRSLCPLLSLTNSVFSINSFCSVLLMRKN